MLTKNEIKYIQSLFHKKQRDADGVFVAEGPKLAAEIINSSLQVQHIYATSEWLQHNPTHIQSTEISVHELDKISSLQTPNEVLVIAAQKATEGRPVFKNTLSLVLDGIQDPGNMGTLIRTADWFGLHQVVCSADCADIYNSKVVQASMGSIARISCCYINFEAELPQFEVAVYGALLTGANIYTMPNTTEGIIIIGNESKGIRPHLLPAVTHAVTIPKAGGAESLNAAVAAGIIIGCLVNGRGV